MSKPNLIFFHNDVDGIFSAAMILWLANQNQIRCRRQLYPLSSQMRGNTFKDVVDDAKKSCDGSVTVLDYQYYPGADLWIDHHFDPVLGHEPVFNSNMYYDPSSPSAAALVDKKFAGSIPLSGEDLVNINIIDSARYKTPSYIFTSTIPTMCIRAYLEKVVPNDMVYCRIVEVLADSNLDVERAAWTMKIGTYYVDAIKAEVEKIKDHIVVSDGMSIIRQRRPQQFPRYAEYYVRPDVKYAVRLTKVDGNNLHLQVGYNKWHESTNQINIGRAIAGIKEAGKGGGHFHVGGAIIKEEDADTVLDKLSIIFTEGVEAMEKYAVDGEDRVEKKAQGMVKTGAAKTISEAREKSALETTVTDSVTQPEGGASDQ